MYGPVAGDAGLTVLSKRVLGECLLATDTYTWSLLRRDFGKSVTDAEAIIADMLRKALRSVGPSG